MLDSLLSMAGGSLTELIGSGSGMDASTSDRASGLIRSTFQDQLSSQVSGGNLDVLKELFSGQETNADNPALSGISASVVGTLTEKMGISAGSAQSIAGQAIPFIMNFFNKPASQAQNNGVDLVEQVQRAVSGQGSGDLSSLFSGFIGGSPASGSKDSGFGMDDLMDLGKKLF